MANNQSVAITLNATDSDALRYKLVSKPSNGVLHGLAPNLTYVPNTGFVGQDSFTFKATDAESDSEPATVRVTVTAPQTEGPSTLTIVLDAAAGCEAELPVHQQPGQLPVGRPGDG